MWSRTGLIETYVPEVGSDTFHRNIGSYKAHTLPYPQNKVPVKPIQKRLLPEFSFIQRNRLLRVV
jgi:hypothetical protein